MIELRQSIELPLWLYGRGGYKMLRPSQSEQMERKTALMFLAAHVKEGCIKM